ncbi:MAG TPA: hypothetical protein EYN54_10250 [Methylococcaceae bacterium]|nr:hypothetical protein [Methylococcaceae bacterium]
MSLYNATPEMNAEAFTECAGATASREPKFEVLLHQANGITSVIEHLRELHAILGVSYEEQPRPERPKESSQPTLVRMLNELPDELSIAHSVIHDMISATIQQLN